MRNPPPMWLDTSYVPTDAELDAMKAVGASGIIIACDDTTDLAGIGSRCAERGLSLSLRPSLGPTYQPAHIEPPTFWQRFKRFGRG